MNTFGLLKKIMHLLMLAYISLYKSSDVLSQDFNGIGNEEPIYKTYV